MHLKPRDVFGGVHDADLEWMFLSPEEQQLYWARKEKEERQELNEKLTLDYLNSMESKQSTRTAISQTRTTSRFRVMYENGITYRYSANWNDKVPTSVPAARYGEEFENPQVVAGDDGIVYIAGPSGYWLPTTTPDHTMIIQSIPSVREPVADISMPVAPKLSPTSQDLLPPGWEKYNDPAHDTDYYVNQELGLTQWERPDAPVQPIAVSQPRPMEHTSNASFQPSGATAASTQEERDIQFLVSMGFGSPQECHQMLSRCNGDANEAANRFLSGESA